MLEILKYKSTCTRRKAAETYLLNTGDDRQSKCPTLEHPCSHEPPSRLNPWCNADHHHAKILPRQGNRPYPSTELNGLNPIRPPNSSFLRNTSLPCQSVQYQRSIRGSQSQSPRAANKPPNKAQVPGNKHHWWEREDFRASNLAVHAKCATRVQCDSSEVSPHMAVSHSVTSASRHRDLPTPSQRLRPPNANFT